MISIDCGTGMTTTRGQYRGLLRQELIARNQAYAALHQLPHTTSYGETPVVVYQPSQSGLRHGNFISGSYQTILKKAAWRRRLEKVHTTAKQTLPKQGYVWRELDSSMSSDALLMNIFCYPGVTGRNDVSSLLGIEIGAVPQFGFRPHVPLLNAKVERTEIDMKIGTVLFEAKLTEGDFQVQNAEFVEQYCDLTDVFDCRKLPRIKSRYLSYQLIRNVLAAYSLDMDFCLLLDARRPDLLAHWFGVVQCIRSCILRTRCKVLTWQELAPCLPLRLAHFLESKYGIQSSTRAVTHREPCFAGAWGYLDGPV